MIFKKTRSAFAIVACLSVATSALAEVQQPMSCGDIMNRAEVKTSVEAKLPADANGQQPSIESCKQHQKGLAITFRDGRYAFVKVVRVRPGKVTVEVINKSAPKLQQGTGKAERGCLNCHILRPGFRTDHGFINPTHGE
ncbi:MAG: hypothetical protein JSS53_02875 [Proteobacteria bacterium]|nr:hypothetical protein [Pseudomonadota bacterium]